MTPDLSDDDYSSIDCEDQDATESVVLSADVDDGDDDDNKGPLRTKHEVSEDVIESISLHEIVRLYSDDIRGDHCSNDSCNKSSEEAVPLSHIEIPREELVQVGKIVSYISTENTILVQSIPDILSVSKPTVILQEGSICVIIKTANQVNDLGNRESIGDCNIGVLGRVSEVFGPVHAPFYIIKHKSSNTALPADSSGSAVPLTPISITESQVIDKKSAEVCHIDNVAATQEQAVFSNSRLSNNPASPDDFSNTLSKSLKYKVNVLTNEEAKTHIKSDLPVFSLLKQSTFITPEIVHQLKMMCGKGSDASNAFDEEVPEDEQEFSDDEEEIHVKSLAKTQKGLQLQNRLNCNSVTVVGGIGLDKSESRRNPSKKHKSSVPVNSVELYNQTSPYIHNSINGSGCKDIASAGFPTHSVVQAPSMYQLPVPYMFSQHQSLPSHAYNNYSIQPQPVALPWLGFGLSKDVSTTPQPPPPTSPPPHRNQVLLPQCLPTQYQSLNFPPQLTPYSVLTPHHPDPVYTRKPLPKK